jgi:hypothetical protein
MGKPTLRPDDLAACVRAAVPQAIAHRNEQLAVAPTNHSDNTAHGLL